MKDWLNEWENKQDKDRDVIEVTKRGVYKDLEKSPYFVQYEEHIFKFSSEAKMRKFSTSMIFKIYRLKNSLQRIFGEEYDEKKLNIALLIKLLHITTYNKMKIK